MKRRNKRGVRAFTLIELLVAMAIMAVVIPVIAQALRVATLASDVAQRKALAARIADRVLNEAVIAGTTATQPSGNEQTGPYAFSWHITDEPWDQLNSMVTLNNPNSVNTAVVTPSLLHQVSADVSYVVQNRKYSVRISTVIPIVSQ